MNIIICWGYFLDIILNVLLVYNFGKIGVDVIGLLWRLWKIVFVVN